jgi:hypothetical protein
VTGGDHLASFLYVLMRDHARLDHRELERTIERAKRVTMSSSGRREAARRLARKLER